MCAQGHLAPVLIVQPGLGRPSGAARPADMEDHSAREKDDAWTGRSYSPCPQAGPWAFPWDPPSSSCLSPALSQLPLCLASAGSSVLWILQGSFQITALLKSQREARRETGR